MKKDYIFDQKELKTLLDSKTKKELVEIIFENFKKVSEFQDSFTILYGTDEMKNALLEAYKAKIHDGFFKARSYSSIKPVNLKKPIGEFKKICNDDVYLLDLTLAYVECGCEFVNNAGYINSVTHKSIESMFKNAVTLLNKQKNDELFRKYKKKLEDIIKMSANYEYYIDLEFMFYKIKWINIDDVSFDKEIIPEVKAYIINRLKDRYEMPFVNGKVDIVEATNKIIDYAFLFNHIVTSLQIECTFEDICNYIREATYFPTDVIKFILWQKNCFDMENYNVKFSKVCLKCGQRELYFREIKEEDFKYKIQCRNCNEEFSGDLRMGE